MSIDKTRDPTRIDLVLSAIKEIWAEQPDTRLGQLIMNVLRPGEPFPRLFYLEDEELVRCLVEYKEWVKGSKLRG